MWPDPESPDYPGYWEPELPDGYRVPDDAEPIDF